MFFDLTFGPLTEPLTGKHWDRREVSERLHRRLGFYARTGLSVGDRVFLHYGNTPEFFVDLAAIWSLGGCVVPIDTRLTPFEIEVLARAAAPRWSLWAAAPPRSTARALAVLGVEVVESSAADAEPLRDTMPAGVCVALDRDAVIPSVPAVWRLALNTAPAPRSPVLERVFCGSAPLSVHLWSDVRAWTRAPDVWNAYGITETGSWLAGTSVQGFTPEDGLIGEPWGGVIRVLCTDETGVQLSAADACAPGESGHIWVNTAALMRGYLGRDDLTAAVVSGGWFSTGDIGLLDERGWLYLRGRERDEINRAAVAARCAARPAVDWSRVRE